MQAEVLRRDIQCLYHFTKIESLPSIMTNGILPRGHLDNLGLPYQFNDDIRLDGHLGASSLSIEHPNYKMFWRLRMLSTTQQWIVLGVQRNILWEKECAFCHENAASAQVANIPIAQRKTLQAFNNMFAEAPNKPTRAALRLPDKFPTNPMLKVLLQSLK
ncbi:DarT ssDNA thymidine ADP-ribosyltransferase family protein [Methylophilus methylotrophus]|uniref:DarT ssDNA thymidine ADP-ribosyltransferase family protein n=1 Tax=Methylophilus methylotrophus TaxID=17 RepID=UPI00038041EC|nr:DarT ssDNA thymidine ADP-ribosyltransferase family protein [Methylophilus methylotrophus]